MSKTKSLKGFQVFDKTRISNPQLASLNYNGRLTLSAQVTKEKLGSSKYYHILLNKKTKQMAVFFTETQGGDSFTLITQAGTSYLELRRVLTTLGVKVPAKGHRTVMALEWESGKGGYLLIDFSKVHKQDHIPCGRGIK